MQLDGMMGDVDCVNIWVGSMVPKHETKQINHESHTLNTASAQYRRCCEYEAACHCCGTPCHCCGAQLFAVFHVTGCDAVPAIVMAGEQPDRLSRTDCRCLASASVIRFNQT